MQNENKSYEKTLIVTIVITLLIGVGGTILLSITLPEWTTALYAFAKIAGIFTLWLLIDKFGLKDYDTITEIFEKQNIAFAILLGFIILSVATAFGR